MKDHLLVFIPGIMGTELIYSGPGEFKSTIKEPVWGHDVATLLNTLTTNPQRLQITTPLQVGDVLSDIKLFGIRRRVYGPLLSFLNGELGYTKGTDFLSFGYDWRQSNRVTASQLISILRAEPLCRFDSIKIIAHSMGGVIARLLFSLAEYRDVAQKVTSVVQIGTPVRGASRAFLTLKEGPHFSGISELLLGLKKRWSPHAYHLLIQSLSTFPSLFELVPHDVDKILLTETGESYAALDKRAWPLLGEALLREHANTHAMIRAGSQPQIISIYSVDVSTHWHYVVDQDFVRVRDSTKMLGDGTVLVASAALGTDTGKCHPIDGRILHDDLPNHEKVLQILKSELNFHAADV